MSGNSIPSADAIGAIRDLAFDAGGVEIQHVSHPMPNGVPMSVPVAISRGRSPSVAPLAHVFEPWRTRPERKSGTARALTLQSLIDLADRHATEHSAIFAETDWQKPSITVVVDYHKLNQVVAVGGTGDSGEEPQANAEAASFDAVMAEEIQVPGEPDFGKHRIHYAFPLSEPWKAWVEKDGEVMDQGDFAAFIEDHIAELSAPTDAERIWLERDFQTTVATPAQLIQLSRGLQVSINAVVKNVVTLQTGEGQVTFNEEHVGADGKPLKVPGLFVLNIAPFFMGETISIPVRLRYRPAGGKVRWFFQIYRPDEHITARVRADLRKVVDATGLPAYEGSPEMAA